MMGVRTPETCWAVHNCQEINFRTGTVIRSETRVGLHGVTAINIIFLAQPLVPNYCRCRELLLSLITFRNRQTDRHTHTHMRAHTHTHTDTHTHTL
jgi:hypothetical protein